MGERVDVADRRQGTTTTGLVAWWATWSLTEPRTAFVELAVTAGADDDERGEAAGVDEGGAGPVGDGAALDGCDESAGVDGGELLVQEAVGAGLELGRVGPRGVEAGGRGGQVPGVHGEHGQAPAAGVVDGPLQRPS